ncbi:hypothetical protein [Donghicola mangrovi]|uniref:Uncharacterized protein n=1 Tax=Donghicola mangrovi TaxID=2729614 RepID=A0A850Q869_9RHOB|nr:hypothetical protein [Donghicola mangrovi]NVO25114.1 hypothetical protein [Donghicola mangrovi]
MTKVSTIRAALFAAVSVCAVSAQAMPMSVVVVASSGSFGAARSIADKDGAGKTESTKQGCSGSGEASATTGTDASDDTATDDSASDDTAASDETATDDTATEETTDDTSTEDTTSDDTTTEDTSTTDTSGTGISVGGALTAS